MVQHGLCMKFNPLLLIDSLILYNYSDIIKWSFIYFHLDKQNLITLVTIHILREFR